MITWWWWISSKSTHIRNHHLMNVCTLIVWCRWLNQMYMTESSLTQHIDSGDSNIIQIDTRCSNNLWRIWDMVKTHSETQSGRNHSRNQSMRVVLRQRRHSQSWRDSGGNTWDSKWGNTWMWRIMNEERGEWSNLRGNDGIRITHSISEDSLRKNNNIMITSKLIRKSCQKMRWLNRDMMNKESCHNQNITQTDSISKNPTLITQKMIRHHSWRRNYSNSNIDILMTLPRTMWQIRRGWSADNYREWPRTQNTWLYSRI